jgi:hypothetical protein
MISIETQRQRIVEVTLDDSEVINFDSGSIYWLPGAEEWLLIETIEDNKKCTFGQLDKLVELIPDDEIQSYYEEIAWQFEEEELEAAE